MGVLDGYFKKLSAEDEVEGFDCGSERWEKEVGDFLPQNALQEQDIGLNVTWLYYNDSQLLGFVSLLASSIDLKHGSELREHLRLGHVSYRSFPSIKVGRFAVSSLAQGQKIGGHMLSWVRFKVLEGNVGVRFLTLDVDIENVDGRGFWEYQGFQKSIKHSTGTHDFMLYDFNGTPIEQKKTAG